MDSLLYLVMFSGEVMPMIVTECPWWHFADTILWPRAWGAVDCWVLISSGSGAREARGKDDGGYVTTVLSFVLLQSQYLNCNVILTSFSIPITDGLLGKYTETEKYILFSRVNHPAEKYEWQLVLVVGVTNTGSLAPIWHMTHVVLRSHSL